MLQHYTPWRQVEVGCSIGSQLIGAGRSMDHFRADMSPATHFACMGSLITKVHSNSVSLMLTSGCQPYGQDVENVFAYI